eukprot:gnl/MRDRNA2_/MRDRNA2_86576_c0_seq18.p1 gnl/MRDRNA2_/MRDRNA2_86576_c0~~gnl/MRDRNA2_/MRDRNA2_86576_c0_seq18.p1  ORF type:complete len:499 (+),score=106.52 gnl/MRDRNA2_/MRDRNA2_86576_c0_seq18:88-1584(+)
MGACGSKSDKGGGGGGGGGGGKKADAGGGNMPHKEVKAGGIEHAKFIIDNPGKLHEFYDVDKKKMGEGSYGAVSKCTNKSTGVVRAVKSISKAQMKNLDRFKQEIAIMKMMDHPNIIKLYETFEDHRNIYLIMEMCSGGTVFDRIINQDHLTEVQAAVVMQQLLRGILYMHELNLTHRNLNPLNLLLQTVDPIDKNTLKIINFGSSCKIAKGELLTTRAGAPYYIAPEILAGKYNQSADLWSCGVIMHVLLCGYPPFYAETGKDTFIQVRVGDLTFKAEDWKDVSDDAKNLIQMLLKICPDDRFTAAQAMNHVWIRNQAPKAPAVPLQQSLVKNLKTFQSRHRFKKAALHVIAWQLDDSQIRNLRSVFLQLDSDGDGLLSFQELRNSLIKSGLKNLDQIYMDEVDSDGSGLIDYTEFLAAALDKKTYIQEDVCWSAFRAFDRNGDGKITMSELEQVFDCGKVEKAMGYGTEELMKHVDSNGDGVIDFQEFMQMMRSFR